MSTLFGITDQLSFVVLISNTWRIQAQRAILNNWWLVGSGCLAFKAS
jgi:hypothetical protein